MRPFFLFLSIFSFVVFTSREQLALCQSIDQEEYKKLLEEARQEEDNGKAAYFSYELAKHHYEQNELTPALQYISESVDHAKKTDDDMLLYLSYQLYGTALYKSGDFNKASDNFQRAVKQAQKMEKREFISEGLADLGLAYLEQGRYKRSIRELEEALSLAILDKDEFLQLKCYELLVEAYSKNGDKIKANEYQALYDNIISSHQQAELSVQQLAEMEKQVAKADKEKRTVRYRFSQQNKLLRKTEDSLLATKYSLAETAQSLKLTEEVSKNQLLQIELLNSDRKLADMRIREQEARLKNAKLTRNFIVVAALMAGSLVVVIIMSYRKKLAANKEISRQNENIQSSINYAKRIQEAMLHKSDIREKLLPESFVLYKPRDVVSGDFYWFSEIKSWYDPDVVIAAFDCTGHGIPGAFMSMIGMNAINVIISQGIAETDQILNAMDAEIRAALQQETTGNKDGMDVALCIYRKEKSILEFSGAKNPLIYIQEGELHQIRGDVHSIGGSQIKKDFSFKKHMVPIDQPTTIYLFSDGYQDQFGGEENTKFMSKRFKKLLLEIHEKPMGEQQEILNETIETWKNGSKQTDDILVMGIRLDNFLED